MTLEPRYPPQRAALLVHSAFTDSETSTSRVTAAPAQITQVCPTGVVTAAPAETPQRRVRAGGVPDRVDSSGVQRRPGSICSVSCRVEPGSETPGLPRIEQQCRARTASVDRAEELVGDPDRQRHTNPHAIGDWKCSSTHHSAPAAQHAVLVLPQRPRFRHDRRLALGSGAMTSSPPARRLAGTGPDCRRPRRTHPGVTGTGRPGARCGRCCGTAAKCRNRRGRKRTLGHAPGR